MVQIPGLHDRLNRILHWDLNVSDLGRSIGFYEALTSFRAAAPVENPDAGALVGRSRGTYRSALMENLTPGAALPRIQLVQWIDPEPVGRPSSSQSGVGFYRVVLHVSDLDAARQAAAAQGSPPFAPTTGDDFVFRIASRGEVPFRAFACHDPDGTVVECLQSNAPKLSVVAQWTNSLKSHLSFYSGILGLDLVDTVDTPRPVPDIYGPGDGTVEFSGAFFRVRDDERGYLDYLEPRPHHTAAAGSDTANRLGPARCAFEVDDVDLAFEQLTAARWAGEPIRIDYGPLELDLGGALGRRRVVGFRDPEGIAYQLVAQRRYPWARPAPSRSAPTG